MSSAKAKALGTEWASLLSGPSLEILKETLTRCTKEGFLPYPKLLGTLVPAEEVRERYAALARWVEEKGHFWVGNGPYWVDLVKPVEKILVLRRHEGQRDDPFRWQAYRGARIPWVKISGPSLLVRGAPARFSVEVGFADEPASWEEVLFVKGLLVGPDGSLWLAREIPGGPEGFALVLGPEETAGLAPGALRLEVVAAFRSVALTAWEGRDLVVVEPGG